jgi:hypothetical protein
VSRYIVCPAAAGHPQWHLDRMGKVTGSKAECVTAKDRTGKKRRHHARELPHGTGARADHRQAHGAVVRRERVHAVGQGAGAVLAHGL